MRPATAEPLRERRAATQRTRARFRSSGAIAWIAVGAVLLAGVVFVNLAVLRTNLQLDQTNQAIVQLGATNQQLEGELSVASAAGRIEALAHARDGLVQANPSAIDYVDLARR